MAESSIISRHARRTKTGCRTCKIRKIKCDENKPSCIKCLSTGRNCDGYEQQSLNHQSTDAINVPALSVVYSIPFSLPGSQRDRQLLHFYCVRSASDLGGSLNRDLWYNIVLQYAQQHGAVRQAVLALGSVHWHARSLPQNDGREHIKQYNRAIRSCRRYITQGRDIDPNVMLLCSVLFFNYEVGNGDTKEALMHLENGLQLLKTCLDIKLINPAIMHLLCRLDCQASIYDGVRIPVLNLTSDLVHTSSERFSDLHEAQNSLAILFNSTLQHLMGANDYKFTLEDDIPAWVRQRKHELLGHCDLWAEKVQAFKSSVQPPETDKGNYDAAQTQLLHALHQMCQMFLESSFPHDPAKFTRSPNHEAEEMMLACESIAQSMQLTTDMTLGDNGNQRFTSETGILMLLILLAVKCSDPTIRRRAIDQIRSLSGYKEGLYDAKMAFQVLQTVENRMQASKMPEHRIDDQCSQSDKATDHGSTFDPLIADAQDAFAQLTIENSALDMFNEGGGPDEWAQMLGLK